MAYNLLDRIAPERVLQTEKHCVPCYSKEAVRFRHEVIETNGSNRTFHAGAWLYDGLHEGAALSALRVSKLLGGATI